MINQLLQKRQRPEKGWDPIPQAYANEYAAIAYVDPVNENGWRFLTDRFPAGRRLRVLDLGAGPGHNTLAFARLGCDVTWHDVSARYRAIAERKFRESGLSARFTLGYLEEARGTYDIVLLSQCWNYCLDDVAFARKLVSLLNANGILYATINNEVFFRGKNVHFPMIKRYLRIFQFLLNVLLNVKIGHPFPSHRKIRRMFSRLAKHLRFTRCTVERSGHYTILTVVK